MKIFEDVNSSLNVVEKEELGELNQIQPVLLEKKIS